MYQIFGADIARCAGRERATAKASQRGIVAHYARIQARHDIGEAHAAGVMKMQSVFDVGIAFGDFRHQVAHLFRIRHAGRVGDRHAVEAKLDKLFDQRVNFFWRYIALERTTECRGNAAIHFDVAAAQRLHNFAKALHRLRDRPIDVGTVVAF